MLVIPHYVRKSENQKIAEPEATKMEMFFKPTVFMKIATQNIF